MLHPNHNSLITWGEGLALKTTFESLIQHRKNTARFSQGKGEGKGEQKPKAQTAGAYPGFISMKHASNYCYPLPPQMGCYSTTGLAPAVSHQYPFIHLGEERQSGVKFHV